MASPEVTIDQGILKGSTATDLRGNVFFKFQGVPYAKPPLGNLRFKPPQPPAKWTGVYDATKHRDVCYHKDPLKEEGPSGSENCLFINVYTRKPPSGSNTNLRPVMVWVHGGGWYFGSGNEDLYGPDFLITEDVVVVTFNYRLGLLGFVKLEDPSLEVYGNMGLKDQVMALKWVQKNIVKFGGDPDNVTIFGESAGGTSIHLLVLSPMAGGLFHKAIAQSGCVLNPSAQGTGASDTLASAMDVEGADQKTIYKLLMQKSTEEIFKIQNKLTRNLVPGRRRAIGVVIEKNSPEPFLDEDPVKIISAGRFSQVPFMLGYTTAEGMLAELLPRRTKTLTESIPWYFGYDDDASEKEKVAEKIKKFYSRGEDHKYDLLSDSQSIYGVQNTAIKHFRTSKAPVYLYRMSIESELNILKNFLKIKTPGVSHLDDVGYLFKCFLTPKITPGSIEDISLSRFVKLWTNFTKFGNPTPDPKDDLLKAVWKPVTNENLDFLDIGRELVSMVNPDEERMNFWKKLFAESPAGQQRDYCCVKPTK